MTSAAGQVFGADTSGVVYAFRTPRVIGRSCTLSCLRG
jgi:hypothetical protein